MGASQSTASVADPLKDEGRERASYYEILEVPKTVDSEELKRAYRKKALSHHPDRNLGNSKRSTELFAEIQVAYDVLSDPQERAWYDSHEFQIPAVDAGRKDDCHGYRRCLSTEDILSILRDFRGNISYSNEPTGFYGYLSRIFENIAQEEHITARGLGISASTYPLFGREDSEYEGEVKQFYLSWAGFSTIKLFDWKNVYRHEDAPDRRKRRIMERENRRLRDEAIHEYNDAVRSLVIFVRKRDPRYVSSQKSETERQDTLRKIAADQAARSRKANQAKLENETLPAWAVHRDPDEYASTDETSSDNEEFECVACRKLFKSEKQYQSHESSKRHQKAVRNLKKLMERDNREFHLSDTEEVSKVHQIDKNVQTSLGHGKTSSANSNDGPKPDICQLHTESRVDIYDSGHVLPFSVANVDHHEPIGEKSATPKDSNSKADRDVQNSTCDTISDCENFSKAELVQRKIGKAALKRAKKAARQANVATSSASTVCRSCNASFTSKTKLFQHISDKNHALPLIF